MVEARRASTTLKCAIAFSSKFVFHNPQLGLITNSHAVAIAQRLTIPLYRQGIPIFDRLDVNQFTKVGYRGTMQLLEQLIGILIILFFSGLSLIFAPLLIKLLIAIVLLLSKQPKLGIKACFTKSSISQK